MSRHETKGTEGAYREWDAFVHTDSWAGRASHSCVVIGETPKRYRCRMLGSAFLRRMSWKPGDVRLVPKHAVSERARQ